MPTRWCGKRQPKRSVATNKRRLRPRRPWPDSSTIPTKPSRSRPPGLDQVNELPAHVTAALIDLLDQPPPTHSAAA